MGSRGRSPSRGRRGGHRASPQKSLPHATNWMYSISEFMTISPRAFRVWPWLILVLLGADSISAAPAMEKRLLFGPQSAREWSTAESSIESSTAHARSDKTALHWHVTVDHFAGEPNYPVGWPRANIALQERTARDWSGWDFLQLWIYTDTTRATLPTEPAGLALHTPDREGAFSRPLSELRKGEWVQVKIPLAQVQRHNDVRLMQFHVSESKYRHGDQLDFYFDEVALLRFAEPTLLNFAPESAVLFADAKEIPVRFELAGVSPGEHAQVVCELRHGEKVEARRTVEAQRGPQRVLLDVSQAQLAPGSYTLSAHASGGPTNATAQVRLIESPWK